MKYTVSNGYYKPGKKQLVMKATTKHLTGIEVDGKKMKFGQGGNFYVSDPGLAEAIDEKYGKYGTGEIAMGPITLAESGHHYFFGPSNTKAAQDFWDRYERRKNGKKENRNNA